ncbi:MAG TPA: HNH endonuclease [Candidatus Angelobacter sp.]|nr:HNH endonuclease [Candidatus Angelobacter sp.]
MKSKTVNARIVWKQLEDEMVPRLRLSVLDRVVYAYLVRHSRLEGKTRLRFSIPWLARGIRVSASPTRQAVRRLIEHGALRLVERTKAGHVVEVRLPEEIRGARAASVVAGNGAGPGGVALEDLDFMRSPALRQAIHARERGRCFYCLRRTKARMRCLDHVVPQVEMGRNGYRNLVSCCVECNSRKGEMPVKDFLRGLLREDRLSSAEFTGRMRALEKLAKGGMRPEVRK